MEKNTTQENCKHSEKDSGYGFAYRSGWKGLGSYQYCTACYLTTDFHDDYECNTPEEIKHNEDKRNNNTNK